MFDISLIQAQVPALKEAVLHVKDVQVPEPKSIITATFTAPADDYPLRIFGDNS